MESFRMVVQHTTTGGPRIARFQSARSPILHDLKIVLNSTIPRFSTIFEQNNRDFHEKKNVVYVKKGLLKSILGLKNDCYVQRVPHLHENH